MKKIIIIREENENSILSVLKILLSNRDISSLEDVRLLMGKYHNEGILNLTIKDNIIESLNFIKEHTTIKFTIK